MVPWPRGPGPSAESVLEADSPSRPHWALQNFQSDGSDLCHWSPEALVWVFSENKHSFQPAFPQASPFSPLAALTAENCTRPEASASPGKVAVGLRVWAQPSLPSVLPSLKSLLGSGTALSVGSVKARYNSSCRGAWRGGYRAVQWSLCWRQCGWVWERAEGAPLHVHTRTARVWSDKAFWRTCLRCVPRMAKNYPGCTGGDGACRFRPTRLTNTAFILKALLNYESPEFLFPKKAKKKELK